MDRDPEFTQVTQVLADAEFTVQTVVYEISPAAIMLIFIALMIAIAAVATPEQ